jgi:hypothetical protein
MLVEELDIVDKNFELNDLYNGAEVNQVPIMDEYPDPKNTFELDLEEFSNQEGGFQMSGDDIGNAVQGVASIASLFKKTGLKATIKDTCGRRQWSKKKRESSGWNACEAKVKAIASGTYVDPIRLQREQEQQRQQQQQQRPPNRPRGMSTGAKVGIGLGIFAVLGIVGVIIYKKRKG